MTHDKSLAFFSSVLLAGIVAIGCDVDVKVGESETTEAQGETMDPGDTMDSSETTEGGETTEGETTGPGGTEGSTTDPGNETDESGTTGGTGMVGGSCDPLAQDCPKAEACYPVGDGDFDCAPVGNGNHGDDCEFLNDCGAGLACVLDVCEPLCDVETQADCGPGTCEPLEPGGSVGVCLGSPITCDPGEVEYAGGCYASCDPLMQDCEAGEGCFLVGEPVAFICIPDGEAVQNEACEFVNSCSAGFTCVTGTALPGEPNPGGCTEYCDLSGPETCPDGLTCIDIITPPDEPAGAENVGACVLDI